MAQSHTINIANIIAATDYPAIVRQTAVQLQEKGFISLGPWLAGLCNADLQLLMLMADDLKTDSSAMAIIILTELLTTAEGLETDNAGAVERVNYFVGILAIESLYRKGLIDFARENATFDPDMHHLTLATIKEQP